ncbi:hypothetical protein PIB30_094951, partial [Stylosanthes scabra]|nr:hypothetical protein [Stylosanthes scabra]
MVGGIGFVVVVEVDSTGFVGCHATLEVVYNTVCYWVAVAGSHRNCEMLQQCSLLVIEGIHR